MGWLMSVAAIWLLTCSVISAATESQNREVVPAYRVDLRSVLQADALPQLGTRETPWVPIITLHFLDNQRLAATFVIPAKTAPKLAERGQEDSASPFRVRTAVLDVSTRKVLATPEWPSSSRAAGIISADDRGFVIQTGGKLTRFSPGLAAVEQMNLPACAPDNGKASGDWSPNSSWTGRRVLLISGSFWSRSCWLWIDTEGLQVLASWQDVRSGAIAVSDDRLVLQPFSRQFGDPPLPLRIAMPGGDWNAIPSTLNASKPQFVGQNLLYFQVLLATKSAVSPGVYLMQTDNERASRLETPREGWALGRAAVSRTGARFLIPLTELKGSHPALDISGHSVLRGLLVYDAPFHASPYTLIVRDSKVRNPSAVLSPDGRHLAILGYPEPLLEIFELPPTN